VRTVRFRVTHIKLFACILAGFLTLNIASASPEKPSIRAGLARLLDRGAVALEKGTEVDFMKFITTPDYTVSTSNGVTMSREQVLTQIKAQAKKITKRPSAKTVINHFGLAEDKVITEITTTFTVTFVDTHGDLGTIGKKHILQKKIDSRITWVKTSSGWKMKHSLRSPDHRYVDGKRIARPRFDD
jgi:hypothetical protein